MTADTKVMVFGTFDRLHDGHRFFLREAEKLGTTLVIVVARDTMVTLHKKRLPKKNEQDRVVELSKEFTNASVVLGDANEYAWQVVEKHQPDVIALGYDQQKLLEALEAKRLEFSKPPVLAILPDHQGERLHSSLLGD